MAQDDEHFLHFLHFVDKVINQFIHYENSPWLQHCCTSTFLFNTVNGFSTLKGASCNAIYCTSCPFNYFISNLANGRDFYVYKSDM